MDPQVRIDQVNLYHCKYEMKGFNYSTWTKTSADILLCEIRAGGVSGWGESTMKFRAYPVAKHYAKRILNRSPFELDSAMDPPLLGKTLAYQWYGGIDRRVRQIREGFSIAIHDLCCRLKNQSFYQHMGIPKTRSEALLMPVIHVGQPAEMLELFSTWYDDGYRVFKIKLRGNAREDAEAVRLIRSQVPDVEIYVGDANFGYRHVDELIRAGQALSDLGVRYFQNPIRKPIRNYRKYSEKMNIKFTSDSSAYWPNTRRVVKWRAADLFNLHPNCMGGIDRLYQLVSYAKQHGVSSIMGSSGLLGIQDRAFQKMAFTLDPSHPSEEFGLNPYFAENRSKYYASKQGLPEIIENPLRIESGRIYDQEEISFGYKVSKDALEKLLHSKESFKA